MKGESRALPLDDLRTLPLDDLRVVCWAVAMRVSNSAGWRVGKSAWRRLLRWKPRWLR